MPFKNNPGCGCCGECGDHCDGTEPGTLRLTIAAAANDACADCGDINASWDLDFLGVVAVGFSTACQYRYVFDPSFCSFYGLFINIFEGAGPSYDVWAYVLKSAWPPPPGNTEAIFSKSFGSTKPTCKDWSNLALSFNTDAAVPECDWSSATFKITAI